MSPLGEDEESMLYVIREETLLLFELSSIRPTDVAEVVIGNIRGML
jgi:hypothetical protein